MKAKLIHSGEQKTYALIFDKDDEVIAGLTSFAKQQSLGASHFTAIGAFSDLTLGYFNRDKKDYDKIPVNEQVEALSVMGDIALNKGEPKIHAHVVVGKRDGSTLWRPSRAGARMADLGSGFDRIAAPPAAQDR